MSYGALHALARDSGVPPALAWLWSLLVLGFSAVSVAGNVAHGAPSPVGRLVAAVPPVALVLAFDLLMRQVQRVLTPIAAATPEVEPAQEPASSDRATPQSPDVASPNRPAPRTARAGRGRVGPVADCVLPQPERHRCTAHGDTAHLRHGDGHEHRGGLHLHQAARHRPAPGVDDPCLRPRTGRLHPDLSPSASAKPSSATPSSAPRYSSAPTPPTTGTTCRTGAGAEGANGATGRGDHRHAAGQRAVRSLHLRRPAGRAASNGCYAAPPRLA